MNSLLWDKNTLCTSVKPEDMGIVSSEQSPTLSQDHETYIPTERNQDFTHRDEVEVDKKRKRTRPSTVSCPNKLPSLVSKAPMAILKENLFWLA